MEYGIIFLIIGLLPLYINYKMAKDKNRNYKGWVLLAFFFGWLSTIILAVQTKLDKEIKY